MGVKIDLFGVPFCNSFRPKTLQDQLCYTVDPNQYKDKIDLEKDLSLALFINYNEDREMNLKNGAEDNVIRIDTIGNHLRGSETNNKIFLEPLILKVGNEYNLNNVKEISVTDDFLTLDQSIIKCQNEESLQDCKTRKYVDTKFEQCKCLPFAIRNDDKASIYINKEPQVLQSSQSSQSSHSSQDTIGASLYLTTFSRINVRDTKQFVSVYQNNY